MSIEKIEKMSINRSDTFSNFFYEQLDTLIVPETFQHLIRSQHLPKQPLSPRNCLPRRQRLPTYFFLGLSLFSSLAFSPLLTLAHLSQQSLGTLLIQQRQFVKVQLVLELQIGRVAG